MPLSHTVWMYVCGFDICIYTHTHTHTGLFSEKFVGDCHFKALNTYIQLQYVCAIGMIFSLNCANGNKSHGNRTSADRIQNIISYKCRILCGAIFQWKPVADCVFWDNTHQNMLW